MIRCPDCNKKMKVVDYNGGYVLRCSCGVSGPCKETPDEAKIRMYRILHFMKIGERSKYDFKR